jgi:hypothetical protein
MRGALLAVTLLLVSFDAIAQTAPQPPRSAAEPATRFEKSAARRGVILVKKTHHAESVTVGYLTGMQIRGVSIAATGESDRLFAVVFDKAALSASGRSSSAVLDFDEAVALLGAIDKMKAVAAEMATSPLGPNTEVKFVTRAGFEAGFYQDASAQTGYVQLDPTLRDSFAGGKIGLLDNLAEVLSRAIAKLREAGAR